ncbi:MAG: transcription elongation factor GreA [Desulfovibrionaceae bacterium]|nr:transcription elongation factor GreA [Desulfovibrionaceae bacterium]
MAIPISAQGYQKLVKELAQLKEDRPAIIQAIKEAREQGDLRENAGYDAAREKQGMSEARITYLEARLAQSNIIDLDKLSGDRVVFGCTVTLIDVDTEEEKVYTILGPDEADLAKGSISFQSPVGSALLGHEVGDEVTIAIPKGNVVYEITDIRFLGSQVVSD